jgi:hypothetical protein
MNRNSLDCCFAIGFDGRHGIKANKTYLLALFGSI